MFDHIKLQRVHKVSRTPQFVIHRLSLYNAFIITQQKLFVFLLLLFIMFVLETILDILSSFFEVTVV